MNLLRGDGHTPGAAVWLIIRPFSQLMHSKLIGDSRWA